MVKRKHSPDSNGLPERLITAFARQYYEQAQNSDLPPTQHPSFVHQVPTADGSFPLTDGPSNVDSSDPRLRNSVSSDRGQTDGDVVTPTRNNRSARHAEQFSQNLASKLEREAAKQGSGSKARKVTTSLSGLSSHGDADNGEGSSVQRASASFPAGSTSLSHDGMPPRSCIAPGPAPTGVGRQMLPLAACGCLAPATVTQLNKLLPFATTRSAKAGVRAYPLSTANHAHYPSRC